MPEDDPTIFAHVLEYIYFGTIPYDLDEETMSAEAYLALTTRDEQNAWSRTVHTASKGLIKVYRLADKLCIEGLMNACHDTTRRIHGFYNIAVKYLPTMTEDVPESDKLRQFAVKQMAWYVKEFGWDRAKDELPDIWSKFMEESSENAIELFEAYTTLSTKKTSRCPALWKRDKCQWHVHIDTPRCGRAE